MRYRITIAPDDNDTLLVTCPDLPEVTTFGEDEVDARLRALDAITTALQGRINARQDIPDPTEGKGDWIELGALIDAKVELYRIMRRDQVTKADLGRRLKVHPPAVDRLLELAHDSRLHSIETAFKALGQELRITAQRAA